MHSGHHMKTPFRQWYSSIEHTDVLLALGWVLYIKHWQVWHLVVLHLKCCLNYPGSSCHTDIKDEEPSWPNIWLVPPSSFVAQATGGPFVNKKSQPKCSFAQFGWNLANPQIESEEPFVLFLLFPPIDRLYTVTNSVNSEGVILVPFLTWTTWSFF